MSLYDRFKMADKCLQRVYRSLREGDVNGALRLIDDYGFEVSGDEADDMSYRVAIVRGRPRRAIPPEIREFVCARDQWICRICEQDVEEGDAHLDHIIPVHLGGDDGADNLRLTHSRCNLGRKYEEFDWVWPLDPPEGRA